jgi:hypothetical protein
VADGVPAAKRVLATSTMPSKAPGSAAAGRARTNARHVTSSRARRIQRRDGRLTALIVVRQPASPISVAGHQLLTKLNVGVENSARVASRGFSSRAGCTDFPPQVKGHLGQGAIVEVGVRAPRTSNTPSAHRAIMVLYGAAADENGQERHAAYGEDDVAAVG